LFSGPIGLDAVSLSLQRDRRLREFFRRPACRAEVVKEFGVAEGGLLPSAGSVVELGQFSQGGGTGVRVQIALHNLAKPFGVFFRAGLFQRLGGAGTVSPLVIRTPRRRQGGYPPLGLRASTPIAMRAFRLARQADQTVLLPVQHMLQETERIRPVFLPGVFRGGGEFLTGAVVNR
jgi:hypothetical protein